MVARVISEIRDSVRLGAFDMTAHAFEEMAEDNLELPDVISTVLCGELFRTEKDDPRGTRYIIHGRTSSEVSVAVVSRFTPTGRFLIIIVYALDEEE